MTKFSISFVLAAAAAAPAALAQQGGGQAGRAQLEEITVTAERRTESLQSVPVTVSAFTAEDLEIRQIRDPIDIIRSVPNLSGSPNTGLGTANTYYIRGLGNNESIATFDPPVGTYVDDIFIARQNANNVRMLDVERIEVLRGPQGILFGRNTTAGAVNIITRKPQDSFFAEVEATAGNYSTWDLKGILNVPLGERVAAKLVAYKGESDGFMRNITTGADDVAADDSQGARIDVRIRPTDTIDWVLAAEYTDTISTLPGSREDLGDVLKTQTAFVYRQGGDVFDKVGDGVGTPNTVEDAAFYSSLAIGLGDHSLALITGYRDMEQRFAIEFADWPLFPGDNSFEGELLLSPYIIANVGNHRQFSQEAKLNGPLFDGRVSYVAGAFYMTEDNSTDFADYFTVGDSGDGIPNNGFLLDPFFRRTLKNDLETWALYLQADWDATDRLTLIAGARYTDEKKTLTLDPTDGWIEFDDADIRAVGYATTITESKLTPKAGIEYRFSDTVTGFVTYTEGFKSGGWNGRALSPEAFNDFGTESVESWEIGLKSEWLDRRLRVNATAFQADYLGLQLNTINDKNEFVTDNAGDGDTSGFELEVDALATDRLQLFGNFSTLDSKLTNVTPGGIAAGLQNGQTTARSPKWKGQVGMTYYWPVAALSGQLRLAADASWSDTWKMGPQSTADTTIDIGTQVNVALAYASDDSRWTVALECYNCADEQYANSELFDVVYAAPPRLYQARIRYRFE